uniref:Large ribosomal subunit protein uL15 n=1 Tax=uncultured Microgenomates bacterium Rifle_16ft_4_minimus_5036 TaxID=1665119 RepID=A0A0H4TBY5_9BACT|nr:50S ribosomal protein L15, large subunit ribosomal protein L15 [uncultured Microgenomates bacterium Rifle_16ft_4_minimus_5036]
MRALPKIKVRKSKRLGRGYGSGKGGHTSSRGQKGQKSRSSIGILFEGVKVRKSLYKRLPLRRGKGKFKAKGKPIAVNIEILNVLPQGSMVDVAMLVANKIVDSKDAEKYGVKILGNGKLEKKLTIALPVSKTVIKKVEKAGGKVVQSSE